MRYWIPAGSSDEIGLQLTAFLFVSLCVSSCFAADNFLNASNGHEQAMARLNEILKDNPQADTYLYYAEDRGKLFKIIAEQLQRIAFTDIQMPAGKPPKEEDGPKPRFGREAKLRKKLLETLEKNENASLWAGFRRDEKLPGIDLAFYAGLHSLVKDAATLSEYEGAAILAMVACFEVNFTLHDYLLATFSQMSQRKYWPKYALLRALLEHPILKERTDNADKLLAEFLNSVFVLELDDDNSPGYYRKIMGPYSHLIWFKIRQEIAQGRAQSISDALGEYLRPVT